MSSGTHEGYRRHGTARDLEQAAEALLEALAAVEGRAKALRPALLVFHRDGDLSASDVECVIHATDPAQSDYAREARWALSVIVEPALRKVL